MSVGTLLTKILLDNPSKTHYGSTDPVTGQVLLKFSPSNKVRQESNTELFGPLQLAVTFHGRAKTKIWKKQGNNNRLYRGRAPLFSHSKRIYDDSFRAQPNMAIYIPFELYFPECTQTALGTAGWEPDGRFANEPGGLLPPSFSDSYYGFANRYESFVEYRVGVNVAMQGIQVNIVIPEKDEEPSIRYERPPLPSPTNEKPLHFKGAESVKNEMLLPEADRPSGFRQKAKAAFSSDYYPTYSFDWNCTSPCNIHIGQPLAFHIYIRPREEESTAVVIPEIYLSSFTVEIKGFTIVRAERLLWTIPESYSDEVKATLEGAVDDSGPFSKVGDWSKTINTREVARIVSEFQTYNISRRYRMRVKGTFTVAGKTKEFSKESSITVYPPLRNIGLNVEPSSSAIAGSSRHPYGIVSVEAPLPQYDRPPEYEDAVEEAPLTAPTEAKQTPTSA